MVSHVVRALATNSSSPYGGCDVNRDLGDNYVCLGKGHICDGGVYLGGYGDSPTCWYPKSLAPYAITVILCALSMSFEKLKHLLEHSMPRLYGAVVNAFLGELATLGFVSLLAFVFEMNLDGAHSSILSQIGKSLGLGHNVHDDFVLLHFLLFGFSVTFIFLSLSILAFTLRRYKYYSRWGCQVVEGIEVYHAMPKVGSVDLPEHWMSMWTLCQEREAFLRLFVRFIDPREVLPGHVKIPLSFNLGKYFEYVSAQAVADMLSIHVFDWLALLLLALPPFICDFFAYSAPPASSDVHRQGGSSPALEYTSRASVHPDVPYGIFWGYTGLLLVACLKTHRKLHNIYMDLVPMVPVATKPIDLGHLNDSKRKGTKSSATSPGMYSQHASGGPTPLSAPQPAQHGSYVPLYASNRPGSVALASGPGSARPHRNGMAAALASRHSISSQPASADAASQPPRLFAALAHPASHPLRQALNQGLSEGIRSDISLGALQTGKVSLSYAEVPVNSPPRNQAPICSNNYTAADQWPALEASGVDVNSIIEVGQAFGNGETVVDMGAQGGERRRSQRPRIFSSRMPDADSTSPSVLQPVQSQSSERGLARLVFSRNESKPLDLDDGDEKSLHAIPDPTFAEATLDDGINVQLEGTEKDTGEVHSVQAFMPRYIILKGGNHSRGIWICDSISSCLFGRNGTPQDKLFWFGGYGRDFLARLIRILALAISVLPILALIVFRDKILCTGAPEQPCEAATWQGIVLLTLALLVPCISALILFSIVSYFVIVTSVELMKNMHAVQETHEREYSKKAAAAFNTLNQISMLLDHMKIVGTLAAKDGYSAHSKKEDSFRSSQLIICLESGSDAANDPAAVDPLSHEPCHQSFESTGVWGHVYGKRVLKHETKKKVLLSEISQEQNRYLRDLFDEFDEDKNGQLDRHEMRKLFFMSGVVDLDPEMEEYLFDQMDLDGSGLIAFEEFAVVMLTAGETKLDADQTARRMLRCFDPERRGFITHDKVEARLKEIRPKFDSRPIVRLLRMMDTKRVGKITEDRLRSYINAVLMHYERQNNALQHTF